MAISFEGLGQLCVTTNCNNTVTPGIPCCIGTNKVAAACSEGQNFAGIVANVRGSTAGVIVRGFVSAPYTGANPTTGYVGLAADGTGAVCVNAEARTYLVVEVDIATKTVVFLM